MSPNFVNRIHPSVLRTRNAAIDLIWEKMTETKPSESPVSPKWLVLVLSIVNLIPLIFLNPWTLRRPGQTIADVNMTGLALLVFVGIPALLLSLLLVWYGKRHNWDRIQYAWATLGIAVGFMLLFFGWFAPLLPMRDLLILAAFAGLPNALLLIGQTRAQTSKSPLHPVWVAAAVGTGILLLWLLVSTSRPAK